MKVLRNKNLPDSRIGIGWINDKNGKSDSESYLRVAQKAADESWKRGDDEEKVVKKAKRAALKKALIDSSAMPLAKAGIIGGGTYFASKLPMDFLIEYGENKIGAKVTPGMRRNLMKFGDFANKNSAKLGLAAAAVAAGVKVPKIYKKVRAAKMGAEINTLNRIHKSKREDDNIKK
jgi:hypothetical protein